MTHFFERTARHTLRPVVFFFGMVLSLSGRGWSAPPVQLMIAEWPGGARGAYSLILDDFCGSWASGIGTAADSIARVGGIRFGFAVIVGECTTTDWTRAREMTLAGHEPINHSWSHTCPTQEDWCVRSSRGLSWKDLSREIDSSTAEIERQTGFRPRVFAFPFDQALPEHLRAIEERGYWGSRTGRGGAIDGSGEIDFPARFSYDPLFPKEDPGASRYQRYPLDTLPAEAARRGGWGVREMHGVGDRSWGALSREEFSRHIAWLQRLQEVREIWVAPPSQVIAYAAMRDWVRWTVTDQRGSHGGVIAKYISEEGDRLGVIPLTLEVTGRRLVRGWQEGKEQKVVCDDRVCRTEISPKSGEIELLFAD